MRFSTLTRHPSSFGRRGFLERMALSVGLVATWPPLLSEGSSGGGVQGQAYSPDAKVVVFQGDSVTDAGRNRDRADPNQPAGLGSGYSGMATGELLGSGPGSPWYCYNRGVSGDKVFQLAARWQQDCLDLRPDVLSILIGVNDFWHTLSLSLIHI